MVSCSYLSHILHHNNHLCGYDLSLYLEILQKLSEECRHHQTQHHANHFSLINDNNLFRLNYCFVSKSQLLHYLHHLHYLHRHPLTPESGWLSCYSEGRPGWFLSFLMEYLVIKAALATWLGNDFDLILQVYHHLSQVLFCATIGCLDILISVYKLIFPVLNINSDNFQSVPLLAKPDIEKL